MKLRRLFDTELHDEFFRDLKQQQESERKTPGDCPQAEH